MTTSHDFNPDSAKPLATGTTRAAALLRAVAGAPAGVHETRRGSFMVLVVGTLALLAVISILYVTVGRGDRQMASAAERNDKLENTPDAFANHIAKIVGDSTVSLYSVGGTGNNEIFRRKTWDYPSTSWSLRTHATDPADRQQFTPSGNVSGSTPWLASTEPIWLNFAGAGAPNPALRARRDWAHISNVSPDGAYVNLFNLRQNGFDATPTQMRQNLSYLNADGTSRVNRDFGSAPRGTNDPHPADWSMRQANLFFPVELASPAAVSNPAYLRYQYADADGDGFYDARWQEMVEFRGGTNPITNLLPRDDKYRYFFATRIVDLSSMVNVNTAKDFFSNGTAQAPDAELPFGLSPSEIDLFRLLTLTDAYDTVGPIFGYEYLSNETDVGEFVPPSANYNQYTERFSWDVARTSWELTRQSFSSVLLPPRPAGAITPVWSTGKERYQAYLKTSARPGSVGYDTANTSYTNSTNFDLADLLELHTFWSTNNADVMSRLEAAMGNWNTPNKFSPLRDNRPFSVERFGKADNTQATVPAMLQSQIDLRHMLTTISGARPFRSLPVRRNTADQPNPPSIGDQELKLNAQALLNAGNTNDLFEAYADSLAPIQLDSTRAAAAWNTGAGLGQAMQTEYYGYRGPELAIIASAFMASNMIDMFDTDNRPTVNTLLLAEPFRGILNGDYANFTTREPRSFDQRTHQWASWVDAGQLDLNQGTAATGRLANATTGPTASTVPAINVYGYEAQPFITQVATLTVYTDTPLDSDEPSLLQGDADERPDADTNGFPDGFITIDGDIPNGNVNDNGDLMCRVVAFQITNPFDVDITLSQGLGLGQSNVFDPNHPPIDREQDFYYIEFGGKFYKLSELIEVNQAAAEFWSGSSSTGGNTVDNEFATLAPLTIPRGKSIVVYAMSETERAVARRFAASSTGSTGIARGDGDYYTVVRRWIRHQFGIGTGNGNDKVVEIPRFEPFDINNASNAGVALSGYHNPLSNSSPELNQQVNLWRARRAAPFANANNQHESFLSTASGTTTVDGSPTPPAVQLPERNRRENDQLVDRFRVTPGTDLDRKLVQVNQTINGAYAGDEDGPFNNQNYNGGCTIALWATSRRYDDPGTSGTAPRGAIPAYCLSTKTGTTLTLGAQDSRSPSSIDDGDFSNSQGAYRSLNEWKNGMSTATPIVEDMELAASERNSDVIASNLGGITFANNYLESYLDNRKFEHETTPSNPPLSALRVADMLLPRALGSFEAPVLQDGTTQIEQAVPPSATSLADLDRRWVTLSEALAVAYNYEPLTSVSTSTPAANNPAESLLWLYRPLNIASRTPAETPVLDGGNLRLDDFVLFHDAVGNDRIFNAVAGDYRTGLGQPAAAGILDTFMTLPVNIASLTSPIQGTVNINTVPRHVLNTVPMMAPAPTNSPATSPTLWWWGEPTVFGQTSDIAATVLAYRDKISTDVRVKTRIGTPRDVRIFDNTGAITPDQADQLDGRTVASNVPAIREEPGVFTLGELMAARQVDPTQSNTFRDPSNIDFLGQRDGATGSQFTRVGTESILHKNTSGTYTVDGLQGEYDQKLIPMQGLLATASTRSDYFICWFIVEGYRKEDTTKLTNADPMVPSIRRRFMMVLDRSQCISPGQPAKIRAIKEVPL
ncbi:MAG: hypothetical protein KGS45_11425 [Planctomycetes bacterium]|nr:hypothetical protein [Planctomycetota bacterium]